MFNFDFLEKNVIDDYKNKQKLVSILRNNEDTYDKNLIQKNLLVISTMTDNFDRKRKQTIPSLLFKLDFERLLNIDKTPVETPLKQTQTKKDNKTDKLVVDGQTAELLRTEDNIKFKTMPCKYFHSNSNFGCAHGDHCEFIHDYRYEGQELPVELYIHKRQEALEKEHLRSSGKKKIQKSRV